MSEKIPADIMAAARATVESIFTDLRDRWFLRWLFDERGEECFIDTFKDGEELRGLDHFVQDEIKAAWAEIIARSILAERKRCVSAYMHWARKMMEEVEKE